jgi:hypothetical protein
MELIIKEKRKWKRNKTTEQKGMTAAPPLSTYIHQVMLLA